MKRRTSVAAAVFRGKACRRRGQLNDYFHDERSGAECLLRRFGSRGEPACAG